MASEGLAFEVLIPPKFVSQALTYPIIFIRGLNARGDNELRVGPFRLGRMQRHIERTFYQMKASLVSVDNVQAGVLEEQIQRTVAFVQAQNFKRFHLLGHSVGGLIARAISHHPELSEKVLSVVTMATPHQGAQLAQDIITYTQKQPFILLVARKMGYNLHERLQNLSPIMDPEAVTHINKCFPLLHHIPSASMICGLSVHQQSLPFRVFHRIFSLKRIKHGHKEKHECEHDGLLEISSQGWGHRQMGPYALDHLSQVGFHLYLSLSRRRKKQQLFQEMIEDILSFMRLSETS